MEFSESEVMESSRGDDGDDGVSDLSVAHQAAATGATDTLVAAVKDDPSILETPDSEGLTPLGHAVMAQQLECMKILVKIGANINAQDNFGRSLLSIVAYQGWYDGLMFLIRNGANQQTTDKAGRTPLHAATYDTNSRIIKALLQTLSVEDINQKDNEGMAALHWASFHNRPEYVQLLLRKGANPKLLDIDGKTALHWAAQTGSLSCCRLLVNSPKGADSVNLLDASGKTPVHFAAAAGHKAVINLLAKIQGVDFEAEDPDERTPLHWAAVSGNLGTVNALLDTGVNACPVDMDGGTPLDYARQSGHKDCVEALEDRLGIHPIPQALRASSSGNDREKTSNLGILSGLFKRKKKKKKGQQKEISSEDLYTVQESSREGSQSGSALTFSDACIEEKKKPTRRKSESGKVVSSPEASRSYVVDAKEDGEQVKTFQDSQEDVHEDNAEKVKKPRSPVTVISHSPTLGVRGVPSHPTLPPIGRKSPTLITSKDLEKMADEWIKSRYPEIKEKNDERRTLESLSLIAGAKNKSASVGDICNGTRKGHKLVPSPPNTSQSNPERKTSKTDLAPLKVPRSKLNSVPPTIGVNLKVAELRLDRPGMNRTPTPPNWDSSPVYERRAKPAPQTGIAHDVERYRELTQQGVPRLEDTNSQKPPQKTHKKKKVYNPRVTAEQTPAEDFGQSSLHRISPVALSPVDLSGSTNDLAEFHEERRALDRGLNSLLR